MRQIILDTETTGLQVDQGHRIIEIGCVEMIDRKFTGRHFHHYINPERDIDEGALNVHGITLDFLKNKPVFANISHEFIDFVKGAELIIHNAVFDIGFLDAELALTKQAWKRMADYCRVLDTLLLARQLHVGQRNSLDALCKRYNIDNSHREFHGALLDCHLLAQVYLAMTGGQSSLFGDSHIEETASQQTLQSTQSYVRTHDLPVIKASDDEIAEHERILQAMTKKGKCLWQ